MKKITNSKEVGYDFNPIDSVCDFLEKLPRGYSIGKSMLDYLKLWEEKILEDITVQNRDDNIDDILNG